MIPLLAWGNSDIVNTADSAGFEADDGFLSMQAPPQPVIRATVFSLRYKN